MGKIKIGKENKKQINILGRILFSKLTLVTPILILVLALALSVNAATVRVQSGNLNVSNNLTVNTNTLFVDSANNRVGIGTTDPSTGKLVVIGPAGSTTVSPVVASGDQSNTAGTGWAHQLAVNNYDQTANNWALIGFADNSSLVSAGKFGIQFVDHANNYGAFAFFTRAADGFLERMRITSAGNVGIGTTDPTQKLQVNGWTRMTDGTVDAVLAPVAADGVMYLVTTSNHGISFGTNNGWVKMRIDTNGNVGIGTTSPNATLTIKTGGTTIADSWDVRSDRDLKDQIAVLNVSAFDFSAAKLYSYKLKYSEINPETNQTEQKLTEARVGLMQDEVPVECRVGDAVDTYCLLAMAYVKIAQLEAEVEALKQ